MRSPAGPDSTRSGSISAYSLGTDVLGPIVAEFCLRLWSLGALLDHPDNTSFLFCARGGLRMQAVYERFLQSTGLASEVHLAPLMVSRLVAIRPALVRTVEEDLDHLLPAVAATLRHEFTGRTVAETAFALSGAGPWGEAARWGSPMTAEGLVALLRHPDGAPVVSALVEQSGLFRTHLEEACGGRRGIVLIDTGLHGTSGLVLAAGLPGLVVSSALMASYFPPARSERAPRTFGLSLEADGYSPLRPRTSLLRYWHLVEWLFEPPLSTVRTFHKEGPVIRSNLEVDGWQASLAPVPGSVLDGVHAHLDGLGPGAARTIPADARRAWRAWHRTVVLPRRVEALSLSVGDRTHDFGSDESFGHRPWRGPAAALRGAAMWREGEIAAGASTLRVPLLVAVETAYAARRAARRLALLRGR